LGMKPVALEKIIEQKCLSDYVASSTTDAKGAKSPLCLIFYDN
jgi:hypothetical protein